MNKLGLVALFGLGLSGCAAKYQSLPPTEGVALTIKNYNILSHIMVNSLVNIKIEVLITETFQNIYFL